MGILGTSFDLPNMGGFLPSGGTLMFFAIFCAFLGTGAIISYLIWDWKKFKYRIEIYENVGGGKNNWMRRFDKARLIKVGVGGEEILYLKKNKCYRSAYGRKIDRNTYGFVIGQDGYWYNFLLGDFDSKQELLDIEPIDRDMRMLHVALRRNIEARYKNEKFLDKYGTYLFAAIILIIFLVGMWLIMGKLAEPMEALAATAKTNEQVAQVLKQVLSSLDNIASGSGLRPA